MYELQLDKYPNAVIAHTIAVHNATRTLPYYRGGAIEHDPRRDLRIEFGYPGKDKDVSPQEYRYMYDWEQVAARVVELFPEECWVIPPKIFETEDPEEQTAFETSFENLSTQFNDSDIAVLDKDRVERTSWLKEETGSVIWNVLKRADILSGIGAFGVILLGFDDGKELSEPVEFAPTEGEPTRRLLYVRLADQSMVQVSAVDTDKESPRYGKPTKYLVNLIDHQNSTEGVVEANLGSVSVHWTRIIHVAEAKGSSEVYAAPRLRNVWRRVLDCYKVYGASAEGYYRGGIPGISWETHPQLGGDVVPDATLKQEVYKYEHSMTKHVLSTGMNANVLNQPINDPDKIIDVHITAICIVIGCPKRVFMGSEVGELASSQDKGRWDGRVQGRRRTYLIPVLLRNFLDRLIVTGVLSMPAEENGYNVDWDEKKEQEPLEKAQTVEHMVNTLAKYVQSDAASILPPIVLLTKLFGMEDKEAQDILDKAADFIEEQDDERDEQGQQFDENGQPLDQNGNPPQNQPQRPPVASEGNNG